MEDQVSLTVAFSSSVFFGLLSLIFLLTIGQVRGNLPAQIWENFIFTLVNENANSFFTTKCHFWSVKNSRFSGNTVHKAALCSQMLD